MISLFREKSILAVFALIFSCLFIHVHVFHAPVVLFIPKHSGVIGLLLEKYATHFHKSIITIAYTLFIFFQALRLNIILNNSKMYSKTGYTIAFAYLLLTGLLPNCYSFSPAIIANSILLFLFSSIVKLYNNQNAKGLIFNVGFITSLLIIGYYPAIFIVMFSLIGLGVLRAFRVTEWFILLLGIVAPFYILFAFLYLFNYNFHQIVLYKISFFIGLKANDYWSIATICFLGILAFASFVVWYPNSNKLVIQMRKNWIVLLFLLIITIATIPFYNKTKMLPSLLILVPAAAFLANFFIYPKKKWFINFLILVAVVFIIYNNSLVW